VETALVLTQGEIMEYLLMMENQRDALLSRQEPELTEEQRATCRMMAVRIAKESGIPATIGSVPINVAINKALTRAMRVGFLMGQDSLFGFATD